MSRRLRILHVIHSDEFAGVEQFVRRLATAQSADHDVRVVGGDPALMSAPLEAAGVRFRPSGSLARLVSTVRVTASRVDVINTHMTAADVATVVATVPHRVAPAIVATRHFSQRRGSTGPDAIYRLVERRLDAEIAISRAVAESIAVRSTVIHPGVDPIAPTPESDRRRVVLMAQRLQPEKHSEVGLRAFARSGLADTGWALEIAGVGDERDHLERIARELGVAEDVRFLGFRSDVGDLMRRSGILLATSPFEHFGLTVLEAMAAGLPVVATAAGGHVEMLGAIHGHGLFPSDDAAAAAALLLRLGMDTEARTALGAAQRTRQVADFTLRSQVAATDAVYRHAIEKRVIPR